MRGIPIYLYDAFATRIFGGNIAGVVPDATSLSSEEMQQIAAEIAAPTTGFVTDPASGSVRLRFFTPTQEIDMCGHVVVGVFSALADLRYLGTKEPIRDFVAETTAGPILVDVVSAKDSRPVVTMRQNLPKFRRPALDSGAIAELLGADHEAISRDLPIEIWSTALRHLFVPVGSCAVLSALRPNFEALTATSRRLGVETISVFALGEDTSDVDVHLRDFCPAIGNPEESASGTTNGALACYLVHHGRARWSAPDAAAVHSEQGREMGRPSRIFSEIRLSGTEIAEVRVSGSAVRSLSGVIGLQ